LRKSASTSTMDNKYRPLHQEAAIQRSTLGEKVVAFCFCTIFLCSILLNTAFMCGFLPRGNHLATAKVSIEEKIIRVNEDDNCDDKCPDGCQAKADKAQDNCIDQDIDAHDDRFPQCVFDQIPQGSECYDCLCCDVFWSFRVQICGAEEQLIGESFGISSAVEEVKKKVSIEEKIIRVNDDDNCDDKCPDGCQEKADKAQAYCIDDQDIDPHDDSFKKCVFDQIPQGDECYDCLCCDVFWAFSVNICDQEKQLIVESFGISSAVEEVKKEGCEVGSKCGTCPCCVGLVCINDNYCAGACLPGY